MGSLRNLVLLGVSAEVVIFFVAYFLHPSIEDTFRYAARYSGRLSALVFIATFYLFAISFPRPIQENRRLRNRIDLFAILHFIHFGFLAMSVYLNEIPLEFIKVVGGALAYIMIVVAPFLLDKSRVAIQLIYFYYVSLVMILTYVSRIKGDFQGAEPYWLHYCMLTVLVVCCILFGFWLKRKSVQSFKNQDM